MRLLAAAIVAFSVLAVDSLNAQQTFILLGEEYRSAAFPLTDIGQKSNIYKPGDPTNDGQLFFTPFFAFRTKDKSQLDVRLFNIGPGRARLSLFLLVSPASKLDEIARFIRVEEERAPVLPRFKNIQQSQLIPITFQSLQVRQDKQPIVFRAINISATNLPDVVEVSADMPQADAVSLQQQLEARTAAFSFNVEYTLNARFTASETSGTFKAITINTTEAVQQLSGSGSAFTLTVTKPGVAVPGGGPAVTRRQRTEFLGDLRSEIETAFSVENAKDFETVRSEIDKYVASVFGKPREIAIGPSFAQELSRLSAYKFSPKDLEPDEMNKFVTEWKGTFEKEQDKMVDAATAGSFEAFEVFGASGSANYKSKEYQKELEDIGWKFELKDGKISIPKSLEVHDVDVKKLKEAFDINVKVSQRTRGLARIQSTVSTELNRLNPTVPATTLLRMEEFLIASEKTLAQLRADTQALRTQLDATAQKLNATSISITAGPQSQPVLSPFICPPGQVLVGYAPGLGSVFLTCGTVAVVKP